jgi:hypothetical protein
MKHRHSFFLILTLLLIQAGCGGGGGSSDSGSYTTRVEIVLGGTRSASHEIHPESSSIPAAVDSIRFTVSAPDMATIQRTISVAGKTTTTEIFQVPVGPNRRFLVEALDSSGNVVFQGEVFANVGGVPVSLTVNMVNVDPLAPVFSGLASITGIASTSLTLSWAAASDNLTPQSAIQYLVYMATAPGGQNFAAPTFTTTAGATSYDVTGLNPLTIYYFVVRAKDEKGNIDSNTVEKSATTLAPPDTTSPSFVGLGTAAGNIELLTIDLSWSPAADNVTSSASIVYLIYVATTSGQQNFTSPTFTTSAGANSYRVSGLNPSTRYYFVVRAQDEAGNKDSNTVERSAVIDTQPPSFPAERLFQAEGTNFGEITLTWDPASDNVTPTSQIVYLVYRATVSGGQNFATPTYITPAGATSFVVTGLSVEPTYYFVVRARDLAGNIDTNVLERSAIASPPPA